jgi:crotonobetainyl-CoA:carnitine CoA-transferase CaiB-like acyl-CoA transferase
MPGALTGVKVVDLSWGMPGPMATGQLADHGADVIRVEPPGGDPYRPYVSSAVYDRGKRSIILDLKTEEDMAVLHRLLATADVMLESWKPGTAERLGLGHDELLQRYPRLVQCSISGFGASSRNRDRPGYDSLVSARLGSTAEQRGPEDRPVYLGVPIASIGTALLAVMGITAALYEREVTGRGQWVETSLLDGSLAFFMTWETLDGLPDSGPQGMPSLLSPYRLIVGSFRCGDGQFLGIHTGANGSHGRLMECLGLSDRVPSVRGVQEKTVALTEEEAATIAEEVPAILSSRPRAHWLQLLRAHDVTAIPVLHQTEAFNEPQVRHNGMTVEINDPQLGQTVQVGVAARLSANPSRILGGAPLPGQDTESVLAELRLDGSPRTAARPQEI